MSRVTHWESEEYASNTRSAVHKAILLLTDGIGLESVKCVDICRVGSPTEKLYVKYINSLEEIQIQSVLGLLYNI